MVGICKTEADIETRRRKLIDEMKLDALLITRSEKGMTLIEAERVINIPSRCLDVFDVTGAGDTVIAVFAAACAASQRHHAAA